MWVFAGTPMSFSFAPTSPQGTSMSAMKQAFMENESRISMIRSA
jgi:hypothetical protein